jgi:hypothetical protein
MLTLPLNSYAVCCNFGCGVENLEFNVQSFYSYLFGVPSRTNLEAIPFLYV